MPLADLTGQVEVGETLRTLSTGTEHRGRLRDGTEAVVLRLGQRPGLDMLISDFEPWRGYLHPRVAGTLGYGQLAGRPVAVFQPAPGKPLEAIGPLAPELALRVVKDVAEGLMTPHSRGIACGSVEPANLFFDGERACLTRLGSGRIAALFNGLRLPFGNPFYLAPEVLQLQQRLPSAVSDVYALGILYYELLTGQPPFTGHIHEVLRSHLLKPIPPPRLDGAVSMAAARLLLRMTAKNPEERVPTAGDVWQVATKLLTPRRSVVRSEAATVEAGMWGSAIRRFNHEEGEQGWSVEAIPEPKPPPTSSPEDRVSGRFPSVGLLEPVDSQGPKPQEKVSISVGDVIARGPVGRSYHGTYDGKPAVVKAISSKFKNTPILSRFKSLSPRLTQLAHANVVSVKKIIKSNDRLLLVMEPAGQPLTVNGSLPSDRALDIVESVARGLEAAALRDLHHGDLRPAKVYVGDDGVIRLADFGLAEAACAAAGFPTLGLAFGHPDYLAPEVLQDGLAAPTTRTDVYSLGIVFYQLLTGELPFRADTPNEVLRLHLTTSLPPPPDGVRIPRPVAEVVLRMTAKRPDRRLGSFAAVLEALSSCREALASIEEAPVAIPGEVEEFDPTDTLRSEEEWEELASASSRSSEEQSEEKIEIGLESVNLEGDDGLRKAVEAAQRELAGRYAGSTRAPSVLAPKEQVDTSGMIKAAVGILGISILIVVGGWFAQRDPPRPDPPPVVPVRVQPTDPVEEPPTPEVDKAASRHLSELRRVLLAGRLEDAVGIRASFEPGPKLSAEQQTELRATYAEIDAAVEARMAEHRAEIERLLRLRMLDLAERKLGDISSWASGSEVHESLASRLARQREAHERELTSLGLPGKHDLSRARSRLDSALRGWNKGGKLIDGGGVSLYYLGGKELARDLLPVGRVKGSERRVRPAPVAGSPHGLLLASPARRRWILVHQLKLARPVSVTVDFVLAEPIVQDARFVVLAGCRSSKGVSKVSGTGTEWGISAVELKGKRLTALNTQPIPSLGPKRLIRLELRFVPAPEGQVRLKSSIVDHAGGGRIPGGEVVVASKDLAGRVAVVVEGTRLWITRFEVRGILPKSALR